MLARTIALVAALLLVSAQPNAHVCVEGLSDSVAGRAVHCQMVRHAAAFAASLHQGRLTRITDGSGHTRFRYDRFGQVIEKAQTVGTSPAKVLTTDYNAEGQIEQHTLPSGAEIRYTYRADGRMVSIRINGVEVVREIDYHAFSEVKSWAYNANSRYERSFDLDGRIEGHTAGNTTRTLDFDPASRIMAIADELGPNDWTYTYDTLDRLTEADNTSNLGPNAGQSLSWAYDLTGNRTGETENAIQTPYQTDPTSNRLNQVGTQARIYDAVGNTLDDGQGTQSRYSARNRLIQTTKAGLTSRYQHNAFGERVAKTQAGLTTEYVYDDAGHLIGEYPAGPSAVSGATEVLWLGDTPIAVPKVSISVPTTAVAKYH